jgi:hypothetical protein
MFFSDPNGNWTEINLGLQTPPPFPPPYVPPPLALFTVKTTLYETPGTFTWTRATGTRTARVIAIGGGGGSGGVAVDPSPLSGTIGGDTSFASLIVAKGGHGGGPAASASGADAITAPAGATSGSVGVLIRQVGGGASAACIFGLTNGAGAASQYVAGPPVLQSGHGSPGAFVLSVLDVTALASATVTIGAAGLGGYGPVAYGLAGMPGAMLIEEFG